MENNILELRTIGKIITDKTHFFVDTYQRGYKWDPRQVEDLLNDISAFKPESIKDEKETFYCLQPVVIKQKDNKTELIDGQQRMTTIFIILSYLRKEKFLIDYQTRKKSEEFLNEVIAKNIIEHDKWEDFKNEKYNNIDNYHFFEAYVAVKKWFEKKSELETDDFYNKLINNTKVIWYEVKDEVKDGHLVKIKSQELFARINIGKIPLTNSELIKALFLSDKNLNAVLKNEIAMEWDIIESTLRNDEFWYLLSDDKSYTSTRIDLIFDIITAKNRDDKRTDELFSFRHFNDNQEKLEEYWQKVTQIFSLLQDWFFDRQLFHLIGYLIISSDKNKLRRLIDGYYVNKSSEEFLKLVNKEIKESIAFKNVEEIRYGSPLVTKILLLFNLKTILRDSSNENFIRFPFKAYKKTPWSIEHIHAQNSKGLTTKVQWQTWMTDAAKGLELIKEREEAQFVIEEINKFNNDNLTNEKFQELFDKVLGVFKEDGGGATLHELSNLALLDGGTNSAIGNNIFPAKREKIIEKEKEGIYIPPCTKNVFLKYYSKDAGQMYFWSKNDRVDYLENIEGVLGITVTEKKLTNV